MVMKVNTETFTLQNTLKKAYKFTTLKRLLSIDKFNINNALIGEQTQEPGTPIHQFCSATGLVEFWAHSHMVNKKSLTGILRL